MARLRDAGIADERVLGAIRDVPRDRFVREEQLAIAWEDRSLPLGDGMSISQPLVVASMTALLRPGPGDRVLDVGTGSGYHAAILARLAAHVHSVERDEGLSAWAAGHLADLGIENVTLVVGDGADGLPEAAPFDAINVAAAARSIPPALEAQLAPGGRLVIPVGTRGGADGDQRLVLVRRSADGTTLGRRALERVSFVPLR